MIKLCIKCGTEGHTNRSCKGPVTSFGLIVFTQGRQDFLKGRMYPFHRVPCKTHDKISIPNQIPSSVEEVLFLLVERKDTVGFLNIVQGSYPDLEPYKSKKLNKYIYELTCEERQKLVKYSFEDLWKIAGSDKRDLVKAKAKFDILKVEELLKIHACSHQEADYLMPKGRLKFGETTRQCAIREFSEETGYTKSDVEMLNLDPYEEQFTGTDGKSYKNVFFVARLRYGATVSVKLGDDPNQTKEVRNVGWFNVNECSTLIRDYHQDKKNIIVQVYSLLPPLQWKAVGANGETSSSKRYPYSSSTPSTSSSLGSKEKNTLDFRPNRWNSNWRPNRDGSVRDVASVSTP